MNRAEARQIAEAELEELAGRSRTQLLQLLESSTVERVGDSGTAYQVDLLAAWDTVEGGDLRVIVSVDDGGLSALMPLTTSMLVRPDGSVAE